LSAFVGRVLVTKLSAAASKNEKDNEEVAYLKLTMSAWKWQKTLRKLLARNFEWPIGRDSQNPSSL